MSDSERLVLRQQQQDTFYTNKKGRIQTTTTTTDTEDRHCIHYTRNWVRAQNQAIGNLKHDSYYLSLHLAEAY